MIDTLILDRGHGDIDSNGKYTTAPAKMFKFDDGLTVYEGQENSKYVKAIAKIALERCFKVEYTVNPNSAKDMSLKDRVTIANSSINKKNALYISLHNNAGKGVGTEIFTSKGQTLSDTFAEEILNQFKVDMPNRKLRIDTSDGDKDKEENFYVLKNTIMPAILVEVGFFDNREDYEWLSNKTNIERVALSIVLGCEKAIYKLYGHKLT
jgi:N-acetylmuramoyl-L-alanine amidase